MFTPQFCVNGEEKKKIKERRLWTTTGKHHSCSLTTRATLKTWQRSGNECKRRIHRLILLPNWRQSGPVRLIVTFVRQVSGERAPRSNHSLYSHCHFVLLQRMSQRRRTARIRLSVLIFLLLFHLPIALAVCLFLFLYF